MPLNNKTSKRKKEVFHCPFSSCLHNGSGKSFSGKKFLNQHIAKVHAEKKYFCEKCGKGFGMDWWRKHHEKTCGMVWVCEDCGSKYTSRESLLTHARRTSHELPDHILSSDRTKRRISTELKENPIILVIQPVIQTINFNQSSVYSSVNPRPILPKPVQSINQAHSLSINAINDTEKNALSITSVNSESITFSDKSPKVFDDIAHNQNVVPHSDLNPIKNTYIYSHKAASTQTSWETMIFPEFDLSKNNLKRTQISAGTQTPNDLENAPKKRESRASQCSRRKSKSSIAVGIESTHTQTAESAVVKIKKKRSRRKSVAITTEPTMLMNQRADMQQSLWPNFKDLIYHNSDNSFRNTMSTQTNYQDNKVLCDSQTITDKELFNFDWAETEKKDYEHNICKQPFEMSIDIPPVESLEELQERHHWRSALADFDLFSTNSVQNSNKNIEICDNFSVTSSEINLGNEACPVFSMFTDCPKAEVSSEMSHPVLSHIHTQTMTDVEFNVLANMETQTTDDFSLYDLLEFSDTETQTPWDDFPDIDDSSIPPDQLSIEIQTDFSSLNTDPYNFFSGVQHMIDACSERLSVNIETQTHDRSTFPQLTNSESQTLDISQVIK